MTSWDVLNQGRERLALEQGGFRNEAPYRVALVYPSPYRAAMSSLGYQTIHRILNSLPGVAADRALLPDNVQAYRQTRTPLLTLEREKPVGNYPLVALSVAYELELAGVIECLALSGLPPLAADRSEEHPLVLGGGPLTFSNPVVLGPFCDAIVLGEGEEAVPQVIRLVCEHSGPRETLLTALGRLPGCYVPAVHGDDPPTIAQAADDLLPATSVIITPETELSSMFLVEAARGCSRGCTYCVMRRSTNGGMRRVAKDRILGAIPASAPRVGLVGAAVTDHPEITAVVRDIVDVGKGVGISSLRADRLNDELVELLARGGYRTLTVALDGASERLRILIERKTYERHLLRAAELAQRHGLRVLKIYMMLGLPDENDGDMDELVRFTLELTHIHPRIVLGIAPLVAKHATPLDGVPFAGVATIERRLALLRRGLGGRAEIRPTSARWAWVEYMLAQGDRRAGLAALDAWKAGGSFAAWKNAFRASP